MSVVSVSEWMYDWIGVWVNEQLMIYGAIEKDSKMTDDDDVVNTGKGRWVHINLINIHIFVNVSWHIQKFCLKTKRLFMERTQLLI